MRGGVRSSGGPLPARATGAGRWGRVRRQERFWNRLYRSDPAILGAGPSAFARWFHRWLPGKPHHGDVLVELGCGYGRDAWFWAARGYAVEAVDCAGVGLRQARSRTDARVDPPRFTQGALLPFLQGIRSASVSVVYSNLVLNMDFREREHRAFFGEVRRVLRPGGFHAYSVRSSHDPWYGKGRKVAPDTYDLSPRGSVMHFFSPEYARSLGSSGFRNRVIREVRQGGKEFPIRVLYVVDERR